MQRKLKFEEEVGEISEDLLVGKFDDVIANLVRFRDELKERIGLASNEDLTVEFDPFEFRGLIVYRRAWEPKRQGKKVQIMWHDPGWTDEEARVKGPFFFFFASPIMLFAVVIFLVMLARDLFRWLQP